MVWGVGALSTYFNTTFRLLLLCSSSYHNNKFMPASFQ